MPLDEIHESGHVPLCESTATTGRLPYLVTAMGTDRERLHLSLSKFMKRLPVEKPVARNNYTFQVVDPTTCRPHGEKLVDRDELGWSSTMKGDEFPDDQAQKHGDTRQKLENAVTPEMIVLRTERQTLRRLPRTGAVLFTIRTYTTPVVDLAREPGVPGRLASAVRSWPEVVAK